MVSKRLPNGSDPTAVAPDDPGSLDIVDEFQSNGFGNTKCSDTLQQSALKELPSSLLNSITSTKVEYRHVGSSGLRVSNPILGTLGFGNKAWMDWVIGENEVSSARHDRCQHIMNSLIIGQGNRDLGRGIPIGHQHLGFVL